MKIAAPSRSEQFVNDKGFVGSERVNRFHEMLTEQVNELYPVDKTVTSSLSPYTASSGQRILCDMSGGSITIVLPSSGALAVSRKGASNTLTLQGTVNGDVDPTILYDGSTASLAYFGTEWRYE